MLTKKRVRRNSKRSKKFLLVGGAVVKEAIIKDMAERLNIFKECNESDNCKKLATTIYDKFISERIGVYPSGEEPEELDLSSLEEEKLEKRSKNHIITYIDTHGAIDNKSGPKTVPNNTVICFLAPINETNLVFPINSGSKSINNFMAKLNIDQFKTIIKEKQNLSNLESTNIDTIDYYINYKGFNCFKNSIWYYPGDKYPEVRIGVTAYDVESDITKAEDSKINTLFQPYDIEYVSKSIGFNYISHKKNNSFYDELNYKKINEEDKDSVRKLLLTKLKKKYSIIEDINHLDKEQIYNNFTLSNQSLGSVIESLSGDKTRIIITTCCRNFDSTDYLNQKNFLERELFYYHLNKNKYSKTPGSGIKRKIGKLPICASKYNHYYIHENKQPLTDLFRNNDNNSYGGKIPGLLNLMKKKENLDYFDYQYLATFSIHKISLFIKNKAVNEDEKIKLWKNVISVSYDNTELYTKLKAIVNYFYSDTGFLDIINTPGLGLTNFEKINELYENIGEIISIGNKSNFNILYNDLVKLHKRIGIKSNKIILMDSTGDNTTEELVILKDFSISDINKYKKVHTLIMDTKFGENDITINNDLSNTTVKKIIIYNKKFKFSADCFNKFHNLENITIKLTNGPHDITINNKNITDIYLENTIIKIFQFITPKLKNLNFTDITFIPTSNFPNIFRMWLINCNSLESLYLHECNCDKIISYLYFSKFLKSKSNLKKLLFIKCKFKGVEAQEELLKEIVSNITDDIEKIELDFVSSEGGYDITPDPTDLSVEKLKIFNSLNKTKKYSSDSA